MKKRIFLLITAIALILICILYFVLRNDKEVYDVYFDSNGGSFVEKQSIIAGGVVNKPNVPIYEGYFFVGWYFEEKEYNFNTEVNSNMTLVAKWKLKEEIKVSVNDAESLDENKKEQDITNTSNIINNNSTSDKSENSNIDNNNKDNNINSNDKTNNDNKTDNNDGNTDNKEEIIIPVSEILVNKSEMLLNVGDEEIIDVIIKPSNATNRNIIWKSSNNNVASVTNGKIRAISSGTAVITASVDNKQVLISVIVQEEKKYHYEIVDISSSTTGQCYIFLKDNDNNYVSGTITITYLNGNSEDIFIPINGYMWPNKNTIASITNIRV